MSMTYKDTKSLLSDHDKLQNQLDAELSKQEEIKRDIDRLQNQLHPDMDISQKTAVLKQISFHLQDLHASQAITNEIGDKLKHLEEEANKLHTHQQAHLANLSKTQEELQGIVNTTPIEQELRTAQEDCDALHQATEHIDKSLRLIKRR